MTEFVVHDGYRRISFSGDLIGRASSKRAGVWRWTDINLYRTEQGTYILEKIGTSRVTHIKGCDKIAPDLPRFQESFPGEDPDDDKFQYDDCVPEFYDFPSLLVEKDRSWVKISENPDSVVEALMRYRGESKWFPRSSSQLLDQASQIDPQIKAACTNIDLRIA